MQLLQCSNPALKSIKNPLLPGRRLKRRAPLPQNVPSTQYCSFKPVRPAVSKGIFRLRYALRTLS